MERARIESRAVAHACKISGRNRGVSFCTVLAEVHIRTEVHL